MDTLSFALDTLSFAFLTCSAEKQRYMQYKETIEEGKIDPRWAVTTGCSDSTEKATQSRSARVIRETLREQSRPESTWGRIAGHMCHMGGGRLL